MTMTIKQRFFIPVALMLALLQSSSSYVRQHAAPLALQQSVGPGTAGRLQRPPSDTAGQEAAPPTAPAGPDELLLSAERAELLGQQDQASASLETLVTTFPEAPAAEVARFELAANKFESNDWGAALEALRAIVADTQSPLRGRALILLARTHESLGEHQQAASYYTEYETAGGPLAGYSAIRRAAQLGALGLREEAASAYEQGAAYPIAAETRAAAYESAVELRDQLGQPDLALANVEQILTFAQNATYRAQLLLEAAKRAAQLGQTDKAVELLSQLFEQHPSSGQALEGLELADELHFLLRPYQLGLVYYSHERYAEALPLLESAIASPHSDEEYARASHLHALGLRALGDYQQSAAELLALADQQPDTRTGRQARLDAIQTWGQAGDIQGAIDGYKAFANRFPDDPLAPEALRRVTALHARGNDTYSTLLANLELGQRYPNTSEGQRALIEAARASFYEGMYDQARDAWKMLASGNTGALRAQGLYWAARLSNDAGDANGAADMMRRAYEAAPDTYYGARAADMLGIEESAGLEFGALLSEAHREEGRAWIKSWYADGEDFDLKAAEEVQRANTLEAVHLGSEAFGEWTIALERWRDNPLALYEIGLQAHDAHNERITMQFAQAILAHAPATAGDPPVAIRRLLYPAPFAGNVLAHAARYGVDPRLVLAVMRQESRYNPNATSWVGARGLMQVMPSTAEGIAAALDMEYFEPDDLYHPDLSVRFGAFYIAAQLKSMNGSVPGALAAYNGGLGNAQRWAGGNVVYDPDDFLLSIDFFETRNYVDVIYGFYQGYQRVYRAY
jgi:soluble lytic murein transglycosylase